MKGKPKKQQQAVKSDVGPAKLIMWRGILAGFTALSAAVANKAARQTWKKLFGEKPPE